MVEAFNESQKQKLQMANMLLHLEGIYFMQALSATVGNMFRNKGSKPYEYPSEPYTLDHEYEEGLDMENEEDRKIALQRRNFVTQLNNLFRDIDPVLEKKKNAEH